MGGVRKVITTNIGTAYTLTLNIDMGTAEGLYIMPRTTNGGNIYTGTNLAQVYVTSSGTYTVNFTASTSTTQLLVEKAGTVTQTFYIDNVKVEQSTPTLTSYPIADVVSAQHYYPFGSTMQTWEADGKEYAFGGAGGHEKDFEVLEGWYEFAGYGYDARLARRPGPDPLTMRFPSISPFAVFNNNPLYFVDPTGMSANPVYGTDGSFLGTDDKGIEGAPIIMDQKDFTQGMKHDDAQKLNQGIGSLKSPEALNKFFDHFAMLPSRPDYDGFVTIDEGIAWAKAHPNLDNDNIERNGMGNATPNDYLYLDASKLNFGSVKATDLKLGVATEINLLYKTDLMSSASVATTYALGRTQLKLLDQNGTVEVVNGTHNIYNWDRGGGLIRSGLINAERNRTGINDSHGFPLFIYGKGKLSAPQNSGIRLNAY